MVENQQATVLPIQGPPGAGKTFTGARMICELLRAPRDAGGTKVGITAVSHKVIRKLLEEVLKAAPENFVVRCIEKVHEDFKGNNPAIVETKENSDVIDALQNGDAVLAGGTAWLWSRPEFADSVDVLFVDEAGQMSLADVLAVSQAAKSIVLLGDPQQLEQPIQGTHPPGVAVSALQHLLGKNQTIPADAGLFLPETWRLAPAICQFTSELFYENRLAPRPDLEKQQLVGSSQFSGSGLWFVPVNHEGNQNNSDEEAEVISRIVEELVKSASWIDQKGESRKLKLDDLLIVAPYNAQVFKLAEKIAGGTPAVQDKAGKMPAVLRVGTVDKFQGQEAPVVIYSMTTSSPEDAPRGMEFLYSLNRFNVATSRARCACILVASPKLFEPECKTPRQMKLANALCRYLELAKIV
jgi:superfamily I DNA and/or RNA helicase